VVNQGNSPWNVAGTFWQATQPVSGTFWQATQPVSGTLTANAGTGTFTTNDTTLDLGQASTTSGEKGPLVQGAVTTSAPSYTTAQTSPLSLNTSGGLRVDGSGVTQPVSGTFWQATQPVSGTVTTTPPSNASTNIAQIGGTSTVTGGVAGILAVGGNVANAVTATANPVPVGGIFTTTPATLTTGQTATLQFTAAQNVKHDLTTVAGTAASTGNGTSNAGDLRVNIASDNTAFAVNNTQQGTASQNIAQIGGTAVVADPCQANVKSYVSISQTAGAQLVAGTSAKKIYPCSITVSYTHLTLPTICSV